MTGVRSIPSLKSGVFSTPVPQRDKISEPGFRWLQSHLQKFNSIVGFVLLPEANHAVHEQKQEDDGKVVPAT